MLCGWCWVASNATKVNETVVYTRKSTVDISVFMMSITSKVNNRSTVMSSIAGRRTAICCSRF